MPTPFVTLTSDDPEFRNYLLGTFSNKQRALPVESFRQHSRRERVTFQLIDISEIQKPAWWKIYFKACRPELLGLTLGPFFVTLLWCLRNASQPLHSLEAATAAAFGLFFLHVSAFLFNDFRDHMHGVDLANRRRGSQVIQKGWASAREVRGWAWVNALLALACGSPAVFFHPLSLGAIVLAAGATVIGLSWISSTLAKRGFSDVMVFVGMGPLLTSAAAIICSGAVSPEIILLGTAFGSLAVLTFQMRQLENLFRAGKDSFRTFIGALEFDRAKTVVLAQTAFVAVLQIIIAVEVFHRWVAVFGFVLALIPLFFVFHHVRRAASPISSDLIHLGRRAVLAQAALLLWWGAAIWI